MSAERTDFVDVLPVTSLKTLLSLVKGDKVNARAAALAVDNVASYGLGQFLPDEIPLMTADKVRAMQAIAPCTQTEAAAALEAVMPDESGTMKAGVGKIDWKKILTAVLPFILSLLA